MQATRIGVFGGTFDPIHVAHVVTAVEARAVLGLDRVLMVVAGDPWQKRGRVAAQAEDRYAMVEAVAADVDGVEASDLEIARPGPAYTVDTLEALVPEGELFLIVGSDLVAALPTWHDWERIAQLCTLAVVERPGTPLMPPPGAPWRSVAVPIPRLDVSSTDIRERAATGRPIDGLVPAAAVRVVRGRGLYTARR